MREMWVFHSILFEISYPHLQLLMKKVKVTMKATLLTLTLVSILVVLISRARKK